MTRRSLEILGYHVALNNKFAPWPHPTMTAIEEEQILIWVERMADARNIDLDGDFDMAAQDQGQEINSELFNAVGFGILAGLLTVYGSKEKFPGWWRAVSIVGPSGNGVCVGDVFESENEYYVRRVTTKAWEVTIVNYSSHVPDWLLLHEKFSVYDGEVFISGYGLVLCGKIIIQGGGDLDVISEEIFKEKYRKL